MSQTLRSSSTERLEVIPKKLTLNAGEENYIELKLRLTRFVFFNLKIIFTGLLGKKEEN
jgi:hypothetical protein